MAKKFKRNCDYCKQFYEGYGEFFCSLKCRQTQRNLTDNPAKRPETKRKMSENAKGNKNCVGRILSDETKEKIRKANLGVKQSPDVIQKRVSSWKKTAEKYGGMTPKHKEQLSTNQGRGDKHWNWKGGTSYYRTTDYYHDPKYKPFRKAVLDRDQWACQECGVKTGRIEVHHIKPYASHPELAFDMANVISLCLSCHNKTKKGHPKPRRKGK